MRGRDAPTLDRLYVLDAEGGRRSIYPADVSGRVTRWRPAVFAALIAVYVALSFILIGGRPAVLLDIAHRRFYLLGKTFNAQDVYLLFFLLTGVGFALIMLAALLGRVWCGWACPQTVFTEGVLRRIERWIEGPVHKRQALARAPWTAEKLARKGLKHALYLGISFVLAHVFLAYFVSLPGLLGMVRGGPVGYVAAFLWAASLTAILYLNFFWFREKMCLILCPHRRLQSALQDRDTAVIGHDRRRGEPRGKAGTSGAGDCVDCRRCVAVCPTGIDIRNGLQMECIGCAGCVDACDEIMRRLGRPEGLIRYDSERGLDESTRRASWFWRPRIAGYALAGLAGLVVATTMWLRHQPFETNVLRGAGPPYILDGGVVRNQLLLHLVNKNPDSSELEIAPLPGQEAQILVPQPRLRLGSLEQGRVPVLVAIPRDRLRPGMTLRLRVRDGASRTERRLEARLMGSQKGGVP